MMAKYTLIYCMKRTYYRTSTMTMSKAEIMLIMILFHDSGILRQVHKNQLR